jgi:hypothetical protein
MQVLSNFSLGTRLETGVRSTITTSAENETSLEHGS